MQKAEDLKHYLLVLKQQKKISRLNSMSDTVHFNTASEVLGKSEWVLHIKIYIFKLNIISGRNNFMGKDLIKWKLFSSLQNWIHNEKDICSPFNK